MTNIPPLAPIFQMGKLRLSEATRPAQGRVTELLTRGVNPGRRLHLQTASGFLNGPWQG